MTTIKKKRYFTDEYLDISEPIFLLFFILVKLEFKCIVEIHWYFATITNSVEIITYRTNG